jgi:small subunit ribosomal protein S13
MREDQTRARRVIVARISGVDLPRRKRTDIALTYIFGIGRTRAQEIIEKSGVNAATRVDDLTEEEIRRLREVIEANYKVEGDLRVQIRADIKRLKDLGCYRGLRHRRDLPARGQRTRTNARTRRGRRRLTVRSKKR